MSEFDEESFVQDEDLILQDVRLKADKFILFALWAQLPIATFLIPYQYGTQLEGFLGSLIVCLIGSFSYWTSRGTFGHSLLNGVLLLAYSVIYITLEYGRIEMHFHVFVSFPILLLYKDWRVYPLPILLTAFHHAVFNYCQSNNIDFFGFPLIVFNYGSGWEIVLLHVAFVVMETSFLIYFSTVFRREHLFIANANDILAKRLSKRTKELNDKHALLASSAKLTSLGEMAGGIAHEINNPLAIIKASCLLVDRSVPAEMEKRDVVEKHLGQIDDTVQRITKIVSGLRNLSRSETIDEVEPHTLRECLEDVVLLTGSKRQNREINLKFQIEDEVYSNEVKVQLVQITQVFMNLFNNSIDALSESEGERWISIDYNQTSDFHQIYFRDSGTGITTDKVDKIFDPYFTSKEFGKGTGLGLSISRTIMEKHGGHLTLLTEESNTCFLVEFPLMKKAA